MAANRIPLGPVTQRLYPVDVGARSRTNRARRIARSNDDLLNELRDQFRFLVRSGRHYDDGDESEAKNIALRVRVLVHDTGQSVSLLNRLSVKDRLQFVNTAPPAKAANPLPMAGLAAWTVADDELSARWIATLGQQPPDRWRSGMKFKQWWEQKVTKDASGVLWSRREFVLALANQDGGAHVDDLDPEYLVLTRRNGMGWRFHPAGTDDAGFPMAGNPVYASVRQVGWELEWTMREHLWRELALQGTDRPPLRLPDEPSEDPRLISGDLSKLPYVSFKSSASGRATRSSARSSGSEPATIGSRPVPEGPE